MATEPQNGAARPCSPRWRKEIERAFQGDVDSAPVKGWLALTEHVAGCPGCRLYYDRLGEISWAMEPLSSGASLPGITLDRIGEVVLAKVAAGAKPAEPASWWARYGTRLWMGASLAVTAMAGFVIVTSLRAPDGRSKEHFTARGGTHVGDGGKPAEREPGVTALCVGSEPAPGAHISPPPTEQPLAGALAAVDRVVAAVSGSRVPLTVARMRCKVGDSLQLTYSTPRGRELYMLARGETETGMVRWYAPTSADAALPLLSPDAVDAVLPWSTRLAVRHEPGLVKMTVRFFDHPLTGAEAAAVADDGSALRLELELVP